MVKFECSENCSVCCRHKDNVSPYLNISDYYRLSRANGESMADIWLNRGCVDLSDFKVPLTTGGFRIRPSLGLLFDPCSYLENDSCSVHDAKPLVCVGFPLMYVLGSFRFSRIKHKYSCLKGVNDFSLKQREIAKALIELQHKQHKLDKKFWRGFGPIKVRTINDYMDLCNTVFDLQVDRDPEMSSERSRMFLDAVSKLERIFRGRDYGKSLDYGDIERLGESSGEAYSKFGGAFSKIIFCLIQDEVADRLGNLNGSLLRRVEDLEESYNDLARRCRDEGF